MSEDKNSLSVTPAAGTDSPAAPPDVAPAVPEVDAFDQAKQGTPESSDLLKGIVSTSTSGPEEDLLEAAPEVDMTLLQDVAPPKSVLLLVLKILFVFILVAGGAAILFFTSQLSDTLDPVTSKLDVPNASQNLDASNTEIIALQTDLNFYRYLELKANLDKFSFYGDTFVSNFDINNSQTASKSEKNKAEDAMDEVKPLLRGALLAAQEILSQDFVAPVTTEEAQSSLEVELLFQTKLKEKLNAKASELAGGDDDDSRRYNRNYLQTVDLVGNAQLRNLVLSSDFDALSGDELYELIKKVNGLIVNDMSTIQAIKDGRIKWSDVINEIEMRTIAVDSHYNSTDLFQDVGGIRYVSYDFSSENQSIAIAGETKLFTTLNFTLIADLIDELNRSDLFENASMDSFSKSGSVSEGYAASLRLNLTLQNDDAVVEDTVVNELPDLGIDL